MTPMITTPIKELAEQTFFDESTSAASDYMYKFSDTKMQQFAELIINQCLLLIEQRKDIAIENMWNVDEAMSCAVIDIIEHFEMQIMGTYDD